MKTAALIIAVLAMALVAPIASSATRDASSACADGLTAVTGGVVEADANGDGVTCEAVVTTELGPTLVSVDNSPATPAAGPCPDDFGPMGWPLGVRPDGNRNAVVCIKEVRSKRVPFIAIDDRARL